MHIFLAIGTLALLVVVHEMGHFLAARLQGIHANRFSVGFGPVLLKYQGSQTEYALRAFPLGGFVGFPDDDPDCPFPPDDPNLLRNRPVLDRAIVISAGVIANLIFAYTVFVLQFAWVGVPDGFHYEPGVLVPQVISHEAPAGRAGIQPGDIIVAVNGEELTATEASRNRLVQIISESPEQPLQMVLDRNDQFLSVTVTPERNEGDVGRIGVALLPNGNLLYRRPQGPLEVFRLSSKQFQGLVQQTVGGFVRLVSNFGETAPQIAGPVKIVEWGANIAQNDTNGLIAFAALISVNLAVINILPLPALDGGQLVFLLIEGAFGKPLPARLQENVMQTGLVLLLGLGIFLIIRDTVQLPILQRFFDQQFFQQ
ncbi:MAG: RIP metalloprotease RseP [Prochlorotrichaceae cyanobacterium]|jgi:membrane-associated protease RseP (regulator of RpoE activity)